MTAFDKTTFLKNPINSIFIVFQAKPNGTEPEVSHLSFKIEMPSVAKLSFVDMLTVSSTEESWSSLTTNEIAGEFYDQTVIFSKCNQLYKFI